MINCPIMLIRNLSPSQGLLNGTRLKIANLGKCIIEAIITTGKHAGQSVFLPRITITPSDSGLPFDLRRQQFPIRPAFAITINKSRGQTLDFITFESLSFSNIRVMSDSFEGEDCFTENVVYK